MSDPNMDCSLGDAEKWQTAIDALEDMDVPSVRGLRGDVASVIDVLEELIREADA